VTPVVLAAAADSLASAGEQFHGVGWVEFQHSWHEFFLMAGTAAVTLAGLLFVAISIHVDTLVHESRQHLLALARLILFSYVGVLLLSLMMLLPAMPMKFTAIELIIICIPLVGWTVRLSREKHGADHAEFSSSVLRRRTLMPLIAYGMIMLVGVLILKLREPRFFYWLVGPVCMLLGNATGASWDLLVRTARIRRQTEHPPGA
jgi:hypothetical protein